jgi:signal peptidase II
MRSRYFGVAILVLVTDQLTKWAASVKLKPGGSIELIPGYLRLSYWENSGVAFGLFNDLAATWKPYVLAGMAIIAVIAMVAYSLRVPAGRKLLRLALAIVIGGILGNFVDRVLRGAVIDFIDFHLQDKFYWPTFNIADSAITIGIALILIDTVKNPALEDAAERPAVGSQS